MNLNMQMSSGEDGHSHLEEMPEDAPWDEKPGESVVEQHDIDQIPEVDITEEDLHETSENEENWLIFGGAYESQRLFPGDRITPENVGGLEVEYQFEHLSEDYEFQGTPIVVHGDPPIMYITFGPDHLYAMNARTGEILWSHIYEPVVGASDTSPSAERGAAVLGDTVYKSTLDLGVIAIDRYTGEEHWYYNGAAAYRGEVADDLMHEELQWERSVGTTSSWPPLIYKGNLMKGSFGGEFGVSGFFDAIDLEGNPKWRINMTPEELWVGDSWMHGGGTAWASGAIDPENDLVISPSSNAGPWYGTIRPGWNPYTTGKVASDVETGEYRWHHQDAPHEWWDYDSPSPPIVYSAEVDGEERRLVSWSGKTGWVYTVDAETGQLVQRSEEFVQHLNMWDLPPKNDLDAADWIMTHLRGGSNPEPSSYHPESRTMVVKGTNRPMKFSWHEIEYEPGESYVGMETISATEPEEVPEWNGNPGVVAGLDPVTGEIKWQDWRPDDTAAGGSVTTSTGVTFAGNAEGTFIAYDTETGDQLWEDDQGVGVDGGPMIWHDPYEEKTYVVVTAGGRRGTLQGNLVTVYSLEA